MRAFGVLFFLAGFFFAYKMAFGATSYATLILWWLVAVSCFALLGTVAFNPPKVARTKHTKIAGFSIWV